MDAYHHIAFQLFHVKHELNSRNENKFKFYFVHSSGITGNFCYGEFHFKNFSSKLMRTSEFEDFLHLL